MTEGQKNQQQKNVKKTLFFPVWNGIKIQNNLKMQNVFVWN